MAQVYNNRERLFSIPVTNYDRLQKLIRDFQPFQDLWLTTSDWLRWHDGWLNNPLSTIDPEELERSVSDAYKTMHKCVKQLKDVPACQEMASYVRGIIEDFRPFIPLFQGMRNPGMRSRHWELLSERIQMNVMPKASLTFSRCLELGLEQHVDEIARVAEVAAKEYGIEQALDKMQHEWSSVEFEVLPYKNTGTYILKSPDEASQLLDDHIVMTQSMSFSPYKKPFEERISAWESKLRMTQDVLEEWLTCQRSWLYLEPIFSSDDINRQLPLEGKRYQTVEGTWRKVMKGANEKRQVIELCPDPRLLDSLRNCNMLLEQVQKGLSEYLETKRGAFPRFYFLSDDELLEILSQTKDPTAVQPHLRKCFENIARLHFQPDLQITHMYSAEGEEVKLFLPVWPSGNVEDWLRDVEKSMKLSLRDCIDRSLRVYPEEPRTKWVLSWPGQVVIAGCQTFWTTEVSEALEKGDLLGDLVQLVRGRLSKMQRTILSALIVIEVHAKDVAAKLVEEGVASVNDFEWISQLRYYWMRDDLYIRAVNAEFLYGYEYLGNSGRLVITPLTDRCYLTLMGALHLKFGGAPAGPAGTGKTETTKDLGKALAIQTVVFNCSDQLDFLAMGKFLKGLASSGAWACFDEFNRIDVEVLSVVAQQIATIQKAQQQRVERFVFEGTEIPLVPSCAVFITMNPGYAGRTELPDNLKALFRPVAMMVPDYAMIAEISLYSFGFSDAKVLSKKITSTFKLSSEQLSSQDHYDFGMRAVKTVISAAGNLKRENPEMNELICLRAIRDVNVPKFLQDDLKLFNGIVSDLFPKTREEPIDYGSLEESIRKVCDDKCLKDVNGYITKIIQLYETTVVRHGLMLVGPSGSGKTKCYEVLAAAMTALQGQASVSGGVYEAVQTYILNPKSITMGQLYGEFDLLTHEWTDGILSSLIRTGAAAMDEEKKWYMFDGPVDAVWIENMNTVLDDNKKLCLSSGEIIKLSDVMTLMFEVQDLAVASPATVSRCGMVYLEPSILGLSPFTECWLRTIPTLLQPYAQQLDSLFTRFLQVSMSGFNNKGLHWFTMQRLRQIPISPYYLHVPLVFMLYLCVCLQGERPPSQEKLDRVCELIEPWFIFSLVWSVGATGNAASRQRFSSWLREKMVQEKVFSQGRSLLIIMSNNCNMFMLITSCALCVVLIPQVLCIGPTGTGKTLTMSDKLLNNMPAEYITHFLTFSARTSANQTQDLIDSKLDKRRKGVFGPPLGKYFIFFIDDLNMPMLETYGAQPPIELLRQWMDHGGWYDRKQIGRSFTLVDINFACAMGPPGGGRNPITQRFTRHFNCLSFTEMADSSKRTIFSTILGSWMGELKLFDSRRSSKKRPVVDATIKVYSTITSELLPTPAKSHYTFNLRDLSKVFQGLLMCLVTLFVPQDKVQLLQLWYHESCRVFQDRLVSAEDRDWFDQLLQQHIKEFGCSFQEVVPHRPLLFGDFMIHGAENRVYQLIEDREKLVRVVEEYMEDYNQVSTTKMKLVLFMDAIQHVCRISRILRQPLGNALLLGVGGSGRQSLTKLATYISEYECFQIELSKNYGVAEWREDIKSIMMKAGLRNVQITFLFVDTQIKSESFLEDINNILNSGDVPNLYSADEQERILTSMKPVVQDLGQQPTKANLMAAYVKRVRSNIHTVLCMSPIGEVFRARLRQFPSLVTCCTIDWFSAWPQEALLSVAASFLNELPELETMMCVEIHQMVAQKCEQYRAELSRYNYVTPKSYLELLSIFSNLIGRKKQELHGARQRMKTGLDKLLSTAEDVSKMQEELETTRPLLEQAAKDTVVTMEKIKETRAAVQEEEAKATEKAKISGAIAADAQKDLDEALPALDAALTSLKSLNKNDVTEVRGMQRPPQGVKLVVEALCIMKGIPPKRVAGEKPGTKVDDYWEPGKGLLQDPGKFLESLFKFDKVRVYTHTNTHTHTHTLHTKKCKYRFVLKRVQSLSLGLVCVFVCLCVCVCVCVTQTYKQQGTTVLKLGDTVIPYHNDFKMYITTKLPNPHYSPEISTKVTLINFTLSPSGLQDQLLGRVVAEERPDLEEAKNQLIVSGVQMKQELKEIEDQILLRLSSSEGNPVDDEELIRVLGASKLKAGEIQAKVKVAEETEQDIDATRLEYVPVAVRTQILFFCVSDLSNVDPMYQYSLEWFLGIFLADTLEQRIININEYFTFSLYSNVCRSLFEKHKLMFAFLLCALSFLQAEWQYMLSGGTVQQQLPNPSSSWLSERAWQELVALSDLPNFRGLADTFSEHELQYKAIFDSSHPHREPLPGEWCSKLDNFQRLLVLRCLRVDHLTHGLQDFVSAQLGQRFIEPQTSDLSAVFQESSPSTPLIFVLSPGTDPAADLYKFADVMKFSKKMSAISLGQGQGPWAEAMMQSAMEKGEWVFFQNCHLAPSWMPSLERLIENIDPSKVHRDFRLWLTSLPSNRFPVSILQNGSKMTIEPPRGIKANLLKTYMSLSDDVINSCSKFKSLLLSLCLFHAIAIERRKFGPLGFNIPYEFTDGDLQICISQLKMFLNEYQDIPFKVLKYTAGEINYGGRVTDDWDRRCIMNVLEDFYCPAVLNPNHIYSASGDNCIYLQDYLAYIRNLPINDTPEIFGLHDNANISFAQNETFALLGAVVRLQPRAASSGGKAREEIVEEIVAGIMEKIPNPFNVQEVITKYPVMYEESMNTVLIQEVIRYNKLLAVISRSLSDLVKALKGLVVMSSELELMANSLFINAVPEMWKTKAYPSLKLLGSWVSDLLQRIRFLNDWISGGIPSVFWISGFFFPQAFLTGTLQNFARHAVLSIDTVSFGFKVMKQPVVELTKRPESGCYIHGLFLEGARWDPLAGLLTQSRPKELYTEMAVIWMIPVPNRKPPQSGVYICPIYKTLTRAGTLSTTGHSTNYVIAVELPTDQSQQHWIKQGVALICALDY
uniref:Dynein, axonemal, heavy chain 1 n=1 Tax=Astyanax mexicanus TaxID=7994 RepID=A0A8B9L8A4_ASTMX